MNHPPDDLHLISGLLRATAPAPPGSRGVECLDDEVIAALAGGRLQSEARAAAIQHLASCDWCARTLASVVELQTDPALAREIAAVEHDPGRIVRARYDLPAVMTGAFIQVMTVTPCHRPDQ